MKRLTVIAATALFFVFCDTRLPEQPTNDTTYRDANRIEYLFENLRKSIQTLDNAEYIKCFSESLFVFRADPQDSLDSPVKLADWDRNKEKEFFDNFAALFSDPLEQVDFVPENTIDEQDTLIENILFKITDIDSTAGDSTLPASIRVFVDITVHKATDNLYYIRRWTEEVTVDSVIPGFSSWGALKASLVN